MSDDGDVAPPASARKRARDGAPVVAAATGGADVDGALADPPAAAAPAEGDAKAVKARKTRPKLTIEALMAEETGLPYLPFFMGRKKFSSDNVMEVFFFLLSIIKKSLNSLFSNVRLCLLLNSCKRTKNGQNRCFLRRNLLQIF